MPKLKSKLWVAIAVGVVLVVLGILWLGSGSGVHNGQVVRPNPIEVTPRPVQFIAAGVPQTPDPLSQAKAVFSDLNAHNISIFFPTFQYVEAPETLSLGYEEDFLLPCDEPRAIHQTLKDSGVRLLVPAELYYQRAPLPAMEDDMLVQLINCVGREQIAGVTTYDEPVHTDAPLNRVKELYERVKDIDATIPVFMIHAPVWADTDGTKTEQERRQYLEQVKVYSDYADVVGFNAYGIPKELAALTSPYGNGEELNYDQAIEDYALWLQHEIPEKEHLLVYQGFAFVDHYSQELRDEVSPELVLAASVQPTATEVETMVGIAEQYGVSYVAWWGQSMSPEPTSVWRAILDSAAARSEM